MAFYSKTLRLWKQMLPMIMQGNTELEISKELGVSQPRISQIIKDMSNRYKSLIPDPEKERNKWIERIEKAAEETYEKFKETGKSTYLTAYNMFIVRLAKLQGLDAPQKVEGELKHTLDVIKPKFDEEEKENENTEET